MSNGPLEEWNGIHSGSAVGLGLGFRSLLRGVSQAVCFFRHVQPGGRR